MKKKVSLKWKIGIILISAAAFMIGVLFVFHVKLLKPMYEANKIKAVEKTGNEISAALEQGTIDTSTDIYTLAAKDDLCVRVISGTGEDITAGNMGCPLYRMDSLALLQQIYAAENNSGTYLSTSSVNSDIGHEKDSQSIIYTKLVQTDETNHIVMVYSQLSPVDSTTETLKMQLIYIGAIFLGMMLLITLYMYRIIAKPLMKITLSAKQLPEGKYDLDPTTNRYAEAQDLNSTLVQAAVDIRKADQAKRDLVANVSHDLRTPLTMISGYGEMMLDLPGENNEENIKVIVDESYRLTYLVNDLLDLSKLQENQIELHKADFDLDSMIQTELRKYDVYRINDGYSITYEGAPDTVVNADETRIKQVFNNFMTNAINYGGEKKVVQVALIPKESVARLEVKDQGEGIAEDKLKDIWDRYYKIDREHVRFTHGSGIGLAIVKQILDLHQVQYGVESKLNEGSTFWVELPLSTTVHGSPGVQTENQEETKA